LYQHDSGAASRRTKLLIRTGMLRTAGGISIQRAQKRRELWASHLVESEMIRPLKPRPTRTWVSAIISLASPGISGGTLI